MNNDHSKVPGTPNKCSQYNTLAKSILALTVSGLMANAAVAQNAADSTQGNIGDTLAPEFQQLDQNGDSRLVWSDVQAALEPRLSAANMDPRSTFDQYDADNDDALSEQEFDSLISAIDDAELSTQGTASTDYGASDRSQVSGGTAYPADNVGTTTDEPYSATPGVAADTSNTANSANSANSATDGAIVTTDQNAGSTAGSTDAASDPAHSPEAYEELSGAQPDTTSSDQAEENLIEQPASYDSADEASDQAADYEEGTPQEEPARYEGSSIDSTNLDSSDVDRSVSTTQTDVAPVAEPVGNGTAPADSGVADTNSTTGVEDTVNSSAGGDFTTEQPASYNESAVTGADMSSDQALEEPINQSPVSQANLSSTPAALRSLPITEIQEKAVRNSTGDKIGDVDELVVNRDDGQIGFVVSAGGVMGIGSKKLLAPVEELSLRGDDLVWDTEKSKSELKDSERYNSDNFVVISDQYQTLNDLNQGGISKR